MCVQFGTIAQRLQSDLGVIFRIAVADDHRDVSADAFGTKRGGRERRRHRKEIDGSTIAGAENRAQLGSRNVNAVDDEVRKLRRGRLDPLARRNGIARVGDDEVVDECLALQEPRTGSIGPGNDPDDARCV